MPISHQSVTNQSPISHQSVTNQLPISYLIGDRLVPDFSLFDLCKELQYSGARFSRGAIARLKQRFQSQYLTHKFQILLPYENWKPDHYDEAQLPDDADPDYFKRFIIYIRNAPHICQSAELTKFV
ncbi:hypothetical protein RhiirA5_447378 [Rhizophagus irregularis]|uniref:Uncharacterized protein n=1 Tax=Rhizophagus irregularis TaxID=588596 RepID=A0A2N0NB73_9GLOM|nr:hypothetical protein RhiirA5_447378 [Rhizophagus irregularis]